MSKKIILIGWDAADWKIINPLLDEGLMPALNSLVNRGCMGNIATLEPPLSPMLWTSIATGKRAYDHGILNFTEPDFENNTIKPVLGTSRKTKALWNILSEQGLKTHLVGWWPSHPAEQINGISVSNFFQKSYTDEKGSRHLFPECIFPKSYEQDFKDLVIEPWEITNTMIAPFVPDYQNVKVPGDNSLLVLAKLIAEASSIHAAATYILENHEWDFLGVYYDAIDHFCHRFMQYHPPKIKHVDETDFNLYKNVINAAYIFHDMMLERLLKMAGEQVSVVIVSDHGFHSDHLRPLYLPKEPASPAYEHRQYGILVMAGENIKKDERIFGASLLDVTPTILNMYGLPAGSDMEGKVLHQAFVNYRSLKPVDTWGHEVYSNVSTVKPDPWLNQIAINQLVELGYIDAPEGGVSKNIDKCVNDSQHYLAKAYLDGRKYLDAYNIIKPLYDLNKDVPRYALTYILCCDNLKKYEEAFTVLELLKTTKGASHINFALVEGELLFNQGKLRLAVEKFRSAIDKNPQNAFAHYHLGNCYRKLLNNPSSESAYLQALSIDETNAAFYSGLAQCYFHQERYEESIPVAICAINLSFNIPRLHSLIGESFFRMNKFYEAAGSFELYLKMVPSNLKIRKKLIDIYKKLKMPIKETEHTDLLQRETGKKHITIVSGLPRSGTSMMMQMLYMGGMDIISDKERPADTHNPHGYFEFEMVKSLHKDNTWLKSVQGKGVIKVVAPQIFHLPPRYMYKVFFMRRNLDEILHSQQKMTAKKLLNPGALRNAYSNTLNQFEKFSKEPNVEVLFLDYVDFVSNDKEKIFECINKISEFLDEDLNPSLMYECIDQECYRSKSTDILQEF